MLKFLEKNTYFPSSLNKIYMLGTIISLLSGALGGNLVGGLLKNFSMGTLWNSVAGIAGGGLGAGLLGMVSPEAGAAAASESLSIGSILGSIGGGVAGGGVVMTVIGLIRNMLNK